MKLKGFDRVFDVILCNLLFFLCSIPLVTIGPAYTAMHFALRRSMEDRGSVVNDFFKAFKVNFGQSLVISLVYLFVCDLQVMDYYWIGMMEGTMKSVMLVMLTVLAVITAASISIVFMLQSMFENRVVDTIRNAVLLALMNPLRSLAAMVILGIPVALLVFLPNLFWAMAVLWCFALTAAGALAVHFLYKPVTDRMRKQAGEVLDTFSEE